MWISYMALLGRIILLGFERIVVKMLGNDANPSAALMLFVGLATLFLSPFVCFILMSESVDWSFLKYVAGSSVIYSFAFLLYIKALAEGEVSLVSPLYNFNILFLLLLSVVFLSESLSVMKGVGLFFLLYGATFLNRQKNIYQSLKALFVDRPCQMMMVSSLLLAIGRVIDKGNVSTTSPVLYSFFLYFFVTLYLGIWLVITGAFKEVFSLFHCRPWVSLASGFINAYAYLCLLIAFQSVEVSIAEPLSMLSMVVTLLLSVIVFKEKIRQRITGVLLMFVGAWFLFSF